MKTNIKYYHKDKGFISRKEADKETIKLVFTESGYDERLKTTKYKLLIKCC